MHISSFRLVERSVGGAVGDLLLTQVPYLFLSGLAKDVQPVSLPLKPLKGSSQIKVQKLRKPAKGPKCKSAKRVSYRKSGNEKRVGFGPQLGRGQN